MLIKGTDVIGEKVITLDKGKEVEDVDDVIYEPRENRVLALLVNGGGLFSDAKVILIPDIKSIGRDAVIVESDMVLKDVSNVPQNVRSIARSDTHLTKMEVVTEGGNKLGYVSDILFDSKTGAVEEFEVSQGGFRDVSSGKKRVKSLDIITVGEDAMIVKGFTEEKFKQQAEVGGLEGTVRRGVSSIKKKAPGIAEQTRLTAQELAQKTRERVKEIQENPRTQRFLHSIRGESRAVKKKAQQGMQEVKTKTKSAVKKVKRQQRG